MSTLVTNEIRSISGKRLLNITGSVIQVVSTTKRDIWSGGVYPNWGAVSGLTVTITPTSSSNNVLILGQVSCSSGYWEVKGRLTRNSSALTGAMGVPRGSRTVCTFCMNEYPNASVGYGMYCGHINYLDSPATISPTTYGVEMRSYSSSYAIGVNYNVYTDDNADTYYGNGISTLTAIEVSA